MQNANIRNKPLDRRYLSDEDKETLNAAGTVNKRRAAVKRVKAYRGEMRRQHNKPPNTTKRRAGSGSFGAFKGVARQQLRQRNEGAKVRKSKALRPPVNDVYQEIYG